MCFFLSPIEHLKAIYFCILQGDWARNLLSDYVFPQIASPPRWFAYQNGPAIKTQLPADLHDYSRWLGFTIYALYTIQMKNDRFNYKRQAWPKA